MKVSSALYTYPVLSESSMRDDYILESSFNSTAEKQQTGTSEVSINISVKLEDDNLKNLVSNNQAKIVCHIESPLSSYRDIREIDAFNLHANIVIDTRLMRGNLEITTFIVANESIGNYTSNTFSDFYKGVYKIEPGDVLAFCPTIDIEIEPDDINNKPTQSIIRITSNDGREMTTDLSGDYIIVRLPKDTYSGYKMLSRKDNPHYKLSLMAIVLPVLMDAIHNIQTSDGSVDNKIWARVIIAKLKAGGRGSNVEQYDPLAHSQFLLNNPADGAFMPIIDTIGEDE